MRARLYLFIGLVIVCYVLPWVVNPGAGLSLNAYDLAEWASLHPAVRDGYFITSFLLRLPLACLALVVAFSAQRRLILALIVVALVVALLPPPQAIRALDDPNYRQQAGIALIALIGGIVGLSGTPPRYRRWVAGAAAVVGALACLLGLVQGYNLMRGFDLPTQVGLGGAALIAVFLAAAALVNQTG